MQNLQAHAPEMKEIQQRWKHDKQRQNEELMKFYRDNKINPAASCLPIVLQIPIFISLFFVLRDFEKEVFPQYPGSDLGFLHVVPNITDQVSDHWSGYLLLVLYVASQLLSTLLTPIADRTQRAIFIALPFVFIFFVINFPVGLMLYWVTTNLWTIGQGLVTRRLMPRPATPAKRSSRTPPKEAPRKDDRPKEASEPKTAPAASGGSASGTRRVRRRKRKRGPQARR